MRSDISQQKLYHPLIVEIVELLELTFGVEFTETSGHRPGDPGVHGTVPTRGIDLRCPHYYFGKLVERFINGRYTYDGRREHKKCCVYHDTGSGFHLHIQVHPNTFKTE